MILDQGQPAQQVQVEQEKMLHLLWVQVYLIQVYMQVVVVVLFKVELEEIQDQEEVVEVGQTLPLMVELGQLILAVVVVV
tara:strand:+ start:296 stop:535 length:240 start_codon:yes stop_codon:yes gene_type:complete